MPELKCFGSYGPYSVKENGLPEEDDVFADFIHRFGVERFSIEYGLLLKGREYTRRRVEQMLHGNSLPTKKGRRWVMAKLLQIPPLLLGIETLDDLLRPEPEEKKLVTATTPGVSRKGNIDLIEFQATLGSYVASWNACNVGDVVDEVIERIYHLHDRVLYVDGKQRIQMIEVLYGYHVLLTNIARDYCFFDVAIGHINKALALAKLLQNKELHAIALFERGRVFDNRWEISYKKEDRKDLIHAIRSHDAAWYVGGLRVSNSVLVSRISPCLAGSIAIERGQTRVHNIQDDEDRKKAFQQLRLGGKAIEKNGFVGDIPFVNLSAYKRSIQTCYNNLGSALIDIGDVDEAFKELSQVDRGVDAELKRRHAYNDIQLARVYTAKKLYPIATTLATNALMAIRGAKSGVNIARVAHVYEEIKASGYDNDRDVTKLGIGLMTAQHPELF